MSFLHVLRDAYVKFVEHRADPLNVPLETQKAILAHFPEPRDDIERSYFQYRCQARLQGAPISALLNLCALVLLPIYARKSPSATDAAESGADAVFLFSGRDTILPDSLRDSYSIVQIKDYQDHSLLTREDRDYLRLLRRRYPASFYFHFKCMMKIAMYSHAIARYAPRAVICSEEYSFTSSLLTDYCAKHDTKHINIMHGAGRYFMKGAFLHFDKFYVWDALYREHYTEMRAQPDQFIIEIPPSLIFRKTSADLERVDYTYYLTVTSAKVFRTILHNLSVLLSHGAKIAIRPHPLCLELISPLRKDSRGFILEEYDQVPIEDSLLRTGCAISPGSTVLNQAAYNHIPFIIDDISWPEYYNGPQGREMRELLVSKDYQLLSELIGDCMGAELS